MPAQIPRMKKLGLDPEIRALILNPPEGFPKALGIALSQLNRAAVFEPGLLFGRVFAHFQHQVTDRISRIAKALMEDGLVSLAYPQKSPKGESDLSRDIFAGLVQKYGYGPVSQISIDEVWSALRFRSAHLVGK